MVSLSSINATQGKKTSTKKAAGKAPFSEFVAQLEKVGARHGKGDRTILAKAHDAVAELCNKACCMTGDMQKANARHSKEDMDRIHKVHGLLGELGHVCAGPDNPLGSQNPKIDGEA